MVRAFSWADELSRAMPDRKVVARLRWSVSLALSAARPAIKLLAREARAAPGSWLAPSARVLRVASTTLT